MVRKFVVLTVMAAEGIAPLTQFISATVGNQITPSTAYTSTGITGTKVFAVSPSLPRGLTLDTTTGAVSGKPTAVKAAAAYMVTATDGALSATATITIQVNAVAYQGTTINSKVSQYTVTLKKVGGGALVRKIVVKASPLVARLSVGPVVKGTWLATIAALASDGTVFESYTSARFTVTR